MQTPPFEQSELNRLTRAHTHFVGVDSDGCVFDTMAVKQKDCFHPLIISHWGLEDVETQLRQCAEFVNLYSQWRGRNRFPNLLVALDFLREREDLGNSDLIVPHLNALRAWIDEESALGNAALSKRVAATGDAELGDVLAWSEDVNRLIEAVAANVAPFPSAPDGLRQMHAAADMIVVSQTPTDALLREWTDNGIIDLPQMIAGQEYGTKAEHLSLACADRYAKDHVLMIGDAPGDLAAAREVGNCFFPIVPGEEEASWQLLRSEAFDRFLAGDYAGRYEQDLEAAFMQRLPDTPPWAN